MQCWCQHDLLPSTAEPLGSSFLLCPNQLPPPPAFPNSLFIQDAYRMSDFSTDDIEEVYEVEKILDHRKKRGRVRYPGMCSMASFLMSPCIE